MHSPNQPDEQWRPQKRPPLNTSDNWSPQSARDRLRMDSPWLHSNRSFSSNDVGDWPDWTLSRESTNDSLQKLDDDCGRPPLAPQQRFPPLCYDSAPRPSQAHTRSSSESTPAHSRLSSGSRVFQPFQQLESHWPDSTAAPDWASRVKQHMQNSFQEAPASLVDRDYLQLDAQEYRQLDHLDAQKEYRQLNHLDAQKEYRQLNVQTDFQKEYRAGHQFSNQQEYSYMPPSMQQSALQKDIGKHSDAFRSDAFRTGLAGSASSGQQLYAPTNLSTSTPQQQQMYTSSAPLHQHLYNPSSSGNSAAPLQQMYRHAAQAGMQRQQTYQQIHQKIHMPAKHDPALWADSAPQKPRQYQQRHDKPIGVFVYDFPPSVTLNELVSTFTPFGEIQNIGFDTKLRIKYAFIDFCLLASTLIVLDQAHSILVSKQRVQIKPRYDRSQTPFFEHSHQRTVSGGVLTGAGASVEFDYKTVHISNCPHNINKLELETLVGPVCEIKRIKIFQRAIEKKASAFLTFKTAEMAKRVMAYLKQRGDALFADDGTGTSNKGIGLEYPARVGSMVQNQVIHVPADAQWESSATTTTSQLVEPTGTLSKKARKLAAAENRIVYIRNLEISTHELTALMATHGLVKSMHLVVKPDQTKTCFIQFGTSQGAGAAIASKSGGCTLPRHKRVVLPMSPSLRATSQQLRQYFERVAEIKQIQITDSEDTEGGVVYMVEFVTAVGAAKAIVHAREHPFGSVGCIMADYAPSVNREEEDPAANANVDSVAVAPAAEPQATERQATDANRVDAQSMEGAKQVDHEGEPAVDAADSCASDLERVAI